MAEIESRLKELELHAAQHALWRATVDRRLSEIHEQLRKLTTNRPSSRGSDTPSSTPQESPAARWLEEAKSAASSPEDSAQARCVGFAPSEESARWRHERRGSIPEDEAIEAPTPPPPPVAAGGGVTRKAGGVALEVSVGSRGGAPSRRTFTPHERKGPRLPKSSGGTPQRPSPAARAEGGTPSRAAGVAAASAASAPAAAAVGATPPAPAAPAARAPAAVRAPRRVRAALGPLCEQQRLSRPSGDDGPSAVSCVALDEGGGCAVTGAEDGALALWVRDEGGGGWRLGAVTNAHDDEVESVAMRGALVLSGGGDGKVHAWRLDAEGELLWKLRTLLSVKGDGEVGVLSLAMPPADGGGGEAEADCAWAVCGAQDGRIRVVATAGGTETQALRVRGRRPGAAWVYSLALGDGGGGASLLLGGTFEGLCALWRAAAEPRAPPTFVLERELRPFSDDPNTDGVLSVALNAARGWAAAGTNDGVVRVWAVGGDAQPLASEPAATAGVCALAWRGEGGDELLSGAEDGSCTVWRLAGGGGTLACAQRLTALADHAAEANSIASTAEGDALLVSRASGVLEVYGS